MVRVPRVVPTCTSSVMLGLCPYSIQPGTPFGLHQARAYVGSQVALKAKPSHKQLIQAHHTYVGMVLTTLSMEVRDHALCTCKHNPTHVIILFMTRSVCFVSMGIIDGAKTCQSPTMEITIVFLLTLILSRSGITCVFYRHVLEFCQWKSYMCFLTSSDVCFRELMGGYFTIMPSTKSHKWRPESLVTLISKFSS